MKYDFYRTKAISKTLSANDSGESGGHQAGILVPKNPDILSFFPELDGREKNPRTTLKFRDDSGDTWSFEFIYYNNKFFSGTRNEYRLTGMTLFMRENNLKTGDKVIFCRDSMDNLFISYERQRTAYNVVKSTTGTESKVTIKLKLSNLWKVIDI